MAKNRSKAKQIGFTIDFEYLIGIYEEQEGKCALSGIEFDLTKPEENSWCRFNAPSLDRIDSSKGYIKGNIRFVCYQINAALQHYGTEHFLDLCKIVTEYNETCQT